MMQSSVKSSNISRIGWANETLFIAFNSGKSYAYDDVPSSIYDDAIQAESIGKFFHASVKGSFAHRPLTLGESTQFHVMELASSP